MSAVKIYKDGKFIPFNLSNLIEVPIGTVDYVAYTELDANQLILDGSLVSRELYKDLWEWVQTKPSMLLTEEEWQSALTANKGLACNCYSTGDGSTTFRLPKESVIILPNPNPSNINKFSTDSFKSQNSGSLAPYFAQLSGTNITNVGGTETKPKTITKLPIVYAFGSVYNSGGIDISNIRGTVNDLVATKHIKTYTDLSQIGITKGTEKLKDIGQALPNNSIIIYSIFPTSGHNNVEYPYVSGQFILIKSKNHCSLYFQTDFGRSYEKYFDDRDSYYVENSWKKIADKDKLSVPSNTKISVSLTNQGDSYTPSCDGLIWAKKSGTNSGSYMIISDTPKIENSTFGQVLYDDYGGQYVYNIQGCCAVAKNQTMYFFLEL